MTEIRFYHLQNQPLEHVLPIILEKALERGHRIILKCGDTASVAKLDKRLWTYKPASFLPHGSDKDKNKSDHPVFVTSNDDNPNDADVIFLTYGATCDDLSAYTLCCDMFDGNDQDAVSAARGRWKDANDKEDMTVTYWQQSDTGKWEQKA